jgi:flagellar motor switch protein FliN/FliY
VGNQTNSQAARQFAGVFAVSLEEPLSQSTGIPWTVTVETNLDLSKSEGRSVHFRVSLNGGLSGEFFIEFCEPHVIELSSSILHEEQSQFVDEHWKALSNVLLSAMTGVGKSLTGIYGEINFDIQRAEGLTFGGMYVVPLAVSGGERSEMPVFVHFNGELLEALSSRRIDKSTTASEEKPFDPANLMLVMDVELNVSLRFGRRQLPLHEVLELTSGSVVDLDRQVDDPVELLLDGKVIALGEAVIVDGNYGLRVTQIPQPISSQLLHGSNEGL